MLMPIGTAYSARMAGVLRQNSAPDGLVSPLRSCEGAAFWRQESPARQGTPRMSESPGPGLGHFPTEVRSETPRKQAGCVKVVPVGSTRRKEVPAAATAVGSSAGRIRENSLGRPAWGSRTSARRSGGDEMSPPPKTSAHRYHSPRDDRVPDRSSSTSCLRSVQGRPQQAGPTQLLPQQASVDASRGTSGSCGSSSTARAEEVASQVASQVLQLQREVDEMRRDNSKLQDKLAKAKNLMLLVQKQADDARAERDRERLKAESLQKSSAQLLRQLKRETAKATNLERMLAAQSSRGEQWQRQPGLGSDGAPSATDTTRTTGSPVGTEQTKTDNSQTSAAQEHQGAQLQAPDMMENVLEHPGGGESGWEQAERGCVGAASFAGYGEEAPGGAAGCSAATTQGAELVAASQLVPGSGSAVGGTGAATPRGSESEEAEEGFGAGGTEQKSWEFVVQGQHDATVKPQGGFAPKAVSCYPDDAVERASGRGVVCVCARGRRLDTTVPNQDDFVAARHTLVHGGHIALYGVLDGHGPAGHHCAAFARGALPESLFGQRTLLLQPEETLREAFRQTQASLLEQPFDTEHSGTTVALALVLSLPAAQNEDDANDGAFARKPESAGGEAWLFVAHTGDSRAILASQRGGDPSAFTVTALTKDHRPDDPDEAERIRQAGGEVRRLRETSGAVRVFAKGQDRPGLALTRSLGASASAACGVTAEPEVSAYRLRPGVDVLLLLGTDGLFEFCNNTAAAGQLLKEGVSQASLQDLCGQSRERWSRSSYNETVDDITAVAALLPNDFGAKSS